MPGLSLHADFDRDGRLTRRAVERAARHQWPGAIIVPNLDADRRRLPRRVAGAASIASDASTLQAGQRDDELVRLEIRADSSASLQPGESLWLQSTDPGASHIELLSDSLRPLPVTVAQDVRIELPPIPSSLILQLYMQAKSLPGLAASGKAGTSLSFVDDGTNHHQFTLSLVRRDPNDQEHQEDSGRFTIAPFLLTDRLASVRRLYIVRGAFNGPSVYDVGIACRRAGISLVPIDGRESSQDTWIQDQYQHAAFPGSRQWRELILHLPRRRREHLQVDVNESLAEVVDTHFRSQNVALYRGLWDRRLTVSVSGGTRVSADFEELVRFTNRASQIVAVVRIIQGYARFANPNFTATLFTDWIGAIAGLPRELQRVQEVLSEAQSGASLERRAQLSTMGDDARRLVSAIRREFRVVTRQDVVLSVELPLAGQRISVSATEARRLYSRSLQMQSSQNYGGNIESTPPVEGAPLGKILLGNLRLGSSDDSMELADPDLLRLLATQRKQPIVELNTLWLKVGHVDEMVSVLPTRARRAGFAFVHASSRAAIELLKSASDQFLHTLDDLHLQREVRLRGPFGVISERLMVEGPSPVTRLFRGKAWLHLKPAPRVGENQLFMEPPNTYMNLCRQLGTSSTSPRISLSGIGYVPGEGPPRRYPADVTANELLWAESDQRGESCNLAYDKKFLEDSRERLRSEFPGIDVLPVPVLFDQTHDSELFAQNFLNHPTTALSPDTANLQVLGRHLLVPRPYGPRMRSSDAIAVVRRTMERLCVPTQIQRLVNRNLIRSQRMTTATYWVEKTEAATLYSESGTIIVSYGSMRTTNDVIEAFRDSFPGANRHELERRIIRPNRRLFDSAGLLRAPYSRLTLRDDMVDLFELFSSAVFASLRLRPHYVDSWIYHLFDGQIHCGTNVLRHPPGRPVARRSVWNAPNHVFVRESQIDFGEDEGDTVSPRQP